jgi:nucleoside-diphosphate-sugar epimerase
MANITREKFMKVLFIGGTGIISSACSQLCLDQGIDLYLFNRGKSFRPVPEGARVINGSIRDLSQAASALGELTFDVVVDWIAFTPEQVEADLQLFRGRTGQYIFISSASAYQTPPSSLPVTESTPLDNPFWAYSRAKIACEERLVQAYREEKFPVTIVRPSHTYDKTLLPMQGGYTVIDRMRRGKKVIVHGDGSSLWVLTHHADFARGFVGLLGSSRAIGDSIHITSDELLTWNQIYEILARAAGAELHLVHVPSQVIAAYDQSWGDSLLGDKTHSMIFDNTRIKRLVPGFAASIPFSHGAEEIIAWHDENPDRRKVSPEFDALCDRIIAAQERAWPHR